MSLHTAADGLLGTHVTWGKVEEEMQKALNTTAKFGIDKTVTNISDLKGFLSRIALVEPCWVGATTEEDLPEKFIVKISSQLPLIEVTKLMDVGGHWDDEKLQQIGEATRCLHNREVSTYQMLMKAKHPKIPFTKIYALQSFDDENTLQGYIISEYIPNLHHIGMHESIPANDILPIIHAMAAFSALGLKLSEEETKFAHGTDALDAIHWHFMNEKSMLKKEEMMRNAFPEEYQGKLEIMFKIYRDYYCNHKMMATLKKTCEFFGYQPVFTHSDMWSPNMLCTREDGKVTLKAIIDYQTVSFTTPAQDVGRLFSACLSTKDRREKADFLMEEYYNTFVKELDDMDVPYTLQNLNDSYQVYFPLMTTMVIPGIAPLLEHLQVSEEYKESMKEEALDKMIGLLEDTISAHESSIQKFPKYFEFS